MYLRVTFNGVSLQFKTSFLWIQFNLKESLFIFISTEKWAIFEEFPLAINLKVKLDVFSSTKFASENFVVQPIVILTMPIFYISLHIPATFPAEIRSHSLYSISLLRKVHGTRVIQREQKTTYLRLRKFSAYSCGLNQLFNPVKRLFCNEHVYLSNILYLWCFQTVTRAATMSF